MSANCDECGHPILYHDATGCLAPDMPPEWLTGTEIIADDGTIEPCSCPVRWPAVVRP